MYRPREDFSNFIPAKNSKHPKSRREKVYKRDNYTCVECGSKENLTLDHIHPVSRGGSNKMKNLQTMCMSCSQKKADKIIRK